MAKNKIPKRIAGVKLNKKLRRRGNELLALADSPQGRQTIAMGLSMATAAASMAMKRHADTATPAQAAPSPSPSPPPSPAPSPGTAQPDAAPPVLDAEKIRDAVTRTVQSAMAQFLAATRKP